MAAGVSGVPLKVDVKVILPRRLFRRPRLYLGQVEPAYRKLAQDAKQRPRHVLD